MPYVLRFRKKKNGRNWEIYNKDKDRVVGTSKTRKEAQASIKERYANE